MSRLVYCFTSAAFQAFRGHPNTLISMFILRCNNLIYHLEDSSFLNREIEIGVGTALNDPFVKISHALHHYRDFRRQNVGCTKFHNFETLKANIEILKIQNSSSRVNPLVFHEWTTTIICSKVYFNAIENRCELISECLTTFSLLFFFLSFFFFFYQFFFLPFYFAYILYKIILLVRTMFSVCM